MRAPPTNGQMGELAIYVQNCVVLVLAEYAAVLVCNRKNTLLTCVQLVVGIVHLVVGMVDCISLINVACMYM